MLGTVIEAFVDKGWFFLRENEVYVNRNNIMSKLKWVSPL